MCGSGVCCGEVSQLSTAPPPLSVEYNSPPVRENDPSGQRISQQWPHASALQPRLCRAVLFAAQHVDLRRNLKLAQQSATCLVKYPSSSWTHIVFNQSRHNDNEICQISPTPKSSSISGQHTNSRLSARTTLVESSSLGHANEGARPNGIRCPTRIRAHVAKR